MIRKTLEALILTSALSLQSCNFFEQISSIKNETELRKHGYSQHINACGPRSLSELLKRYNIKILPKNISKEILDNSYTSNVLRFIPSIINKEALQITWPNEIYFILNKYLDKEKYNIRIIHNLEIEEFKRIMEKNKE